MDRIINGLLFNQSFIQIMKTTNIESSYTKYSNEVLNTFVSLDAPLFLSHRIIAFTSNTYFTFTKTGEDQTHIMKVVKEYPWRDQITKANGDKLILPVHIDPFGVNEVPVYSVARPIIDGRNIYGIIEVQNDYDQIKTFCTVNSNLGEIVLLSESGNTIYPWSQAQSLNESFSQNLYKIIKEKNVKSGHFSWKNKQISYSISPYSNWITIMYCPISYIMPNAANIIIALLFVFISLVILTLSLINILTKRLTAPLVNLNKLISHVSFDNLALTLPQNSNIIEIENINHSFQTMFQQLKEEIAKNVQAKANEERANFIALQSQMNPHTIYNTITMIEGVCYMNGDTEAANLCICFSQMLRYISDNTRTIYTVEDEVMHLENYSVLMKKSYEGRLEINVEIMQELLSYPIPKFSLQPLVENSIKYGMNRNCKPFIINVLVETVENGWHIKVSDNGNGFSNNKIEEIYDQFSYCDACLKDNKSDIINMKIGNMALNNIYTRFKILYGSNFKMKIENLQTTGCYIELYIKA
ncbi:MAG: sensor histidine kinase [Lachnospiraceae bacterium]